METSIETPIDQLNEEILRITGMIKVNFPELYELMDDSGKLLSRQHQSESGCIKHLKFLHKQLNEYKAVNMIELDY